MKSQSTCIIVHGCAEEYEKYLDPAKHTFAGHWIPWVKNQLVAKGIPTDVPIMPTPWAPDYETFKTVFEKCGVNEHSILIGHSCGCAFLVRWLGETKQKIHKLILVAPWRIPDPGDAARDQFYTFPIDASVKDRVEKIIMFTADDEEVDGKESLRIFHDALDGEIIELKNHGHYLMSDMGTDEFPELLQAALT